MVNMETKTEDIERKSGHQIKVGAVLSYFVIILQIVITLWFTPWLSSYLGTSSYGLYTLATSLSGIFMLDLGLSAATSKYLSEYRAEHDEKKEAQFLGISLKLYLLIDAVVFIVALILYFFLRDIYGGLTDSEFSIFRVLYLIVGGFSLLSLPMVSLNGILTAHESFVFLKLTTLIQRLLSVGLMALCIITKSNLELIILAHTGSSLLISIIKIFYLKIKCGTRIDFRYWDKKFLKGLFAFTIWIAIIILSQRLTNTFVPQILGMVHDTTSVAIYGFASQLEMYTYQITTVVAGMFMPKIARLMKENPNNPKLYDLFLKVGKFQLLITGLILVGFIAIGNPFVVFLMGTDYEDSYLCAILLIFPSILFTPKTPMESHCYLTNHVKDEAIITIIGSLITFAFFFLFGKFFGAVGVCAVYCISMSLIHILVDFLVYGKKQGIPIVKFAIDCYLPFLLPASITMVLGSELSSIWKITGWKILISQAAIIIFIFLLLVWLFFFTNDERKWLKTTMLRQKRKKDYADDFFIGRSNNGPFI